MRLNNYNYYDDFTNYKLKNDKVGVSVIIPTLNRYKYLADVLKDLELQDYKNFEVIVIDQSDNFNKRFYENFNLELKIKHQKEKKLWKARNYAIKLSKHDLLLFFDDDSRVDSDWILNHLKSLEFFKNSISSGISLSKIGNKIPSNYKYFHIADQIDTGNFIIRKEVFYKTGLYDCQFEGQRMGDSEFGLRCMLNGYKNISNPLAKRIHLKVGSGGLREKGSWDAFRPKSFCT